MKNLVTSKFFLPLAFGILFSCGAQRDHSNLQEEWNSANNPLRILPRDFERKLSELPASAKLEGTPWSDSYWPTYSGGLALRWNEAHPNARDAFSYETFKIDELRSMTPGELSELSPAEKFDILTGSYDYPLLKSERQRTSPDAPGWEGLCHGWASASLNFKEPKSALIKNEDGLEIPFGSADVKALLALYVGNYGSSRTYYVAERCNFDFAENPEAKKRPECRDANAGMFHLVLANKLGKQGKGFIADLNRELQVWNHPIFSFNMEVTHESNQASRDAAPGTVKEVEVVTTVGYGIENSPTWDSGDPVDSVRQFSYRLELNESGEILGGAWLDEARPDFLWHQDRPSFYDMGPIKFSKLAGLLRQSLQSEGIANPARVQ